MAKSISNVVISAAAILFTIWTGWQVGAPTGSTGEFPILLQLALLAAGIQVMCFIPAFMMQTEHFYDLAGSLTYLALVWCAALFAFDRGPVSPLQLCIAGMVSIWALRLGSYLFLRVRRDGKDGRFDTIKTSGPAFLVAWTIQGVWCFVVSLPALLLIVEPAERVQGSLLGWVGVTLWIIGFTIEVTADRQKTLFRANPENHGKWICTGLWARAQHPNYFGEITLWFGIFLSGAMVFSGWQWLAALSPVVTAILLTQVSGVPMVRARNQKKWGNDPEYLRYLREVPLLAPVGQPFEPGNSESAVSSDG